MAIKLKVIVLATSFALSSYGIAADVQDPLPSWNNTGAKQAIMAFVTKTTTQARTLIFLKAKGSLRLIMTGRCGQKNPFIYSCFLRSIK